MYKRYLKQWLCPVFTLGLLMSAGATAQLQFDCSDTLRLTVSTVKRSEDYLSVIEPFLAVMAESVNKKPQLVFTDGWAASVDAFSHNSADLVLVPQAMLATVKANPQLRPVIKTPGTRVVFVTEKSSNIRSVEQLANKSAGVVKDSTEELIAQKLFVEAGVVGSVELISVVTPGDVFMGLFQDRFDGVFIAEPSLDWLQPSFKNKLHVVAAMGKTKGLYLYAGACVNEQEFQSIKRALLAAPADPRITQFIEHFNFGRFMPVAAGDVDQALQELE